MEPIRDATFQKLNGMVLAASARVLSGIYEFVVDPPLPVQPGDVLGIFRPLLLNSKLLVHYDPGDNANVLSYSDGRCS